MDFRFNKFTLLSFRLVLFITLHPDEEEVEEILQGRLSSLSS